MSTVISLDCESNGLHGQIFAFAVAVYEDSREIDQQVWRCPIVASVDPWVAENVIPAMVDIPEDVADYVALQAEWEEIFEFYGKPQVITHVPWPVEARFLWDAHRDEPFSGPFPLIDVASMLLARDHDPTSTAGYLGWAGIDLPAGSPHDPLFDARSAALAYFELVS